MPQPAARQDDKVTGTDIHIVLVPSPSGSVPTPTPHPFLGRLSSGLSSDVQINGKSAATQGSTAQADSPHVPIGGPSFARPPTNQGTVMMGSFTVLVNGKPLARLGDSVATCNDLPAPPTSTIVTGSQDVIVA
jgi:uncharacterized Zn-binding protein involved in type VI secretion